MSASPPDPRDAHDPAYLDSSELADLSYSPHSHGSGYEPLVSSVNPFDDEGENDDDDDDDAARGLGIDDPTSPVSPPLGRPAKRVTYDPEPITLGPNQSTRQQSPRSHEPLAAQSADTTSGLQQAEGFLSPVSPYGFQQDTIHRGDGVPEGANWKGHRNTKPSISSLNSDRYDDHGDQYDPYLERGDDEHLHRGQSTRSKRSAYTTGWDPNRDCISHNTFYQNSTHCLSLTIYILSVYSTVLSGLFLVIAVCGPTYPWINSKSKLNPNGAIILVSVLAKTIELSFATAFVAFLGQALSRRAFNKKNGWGITIAEMNMRTWIMQPGVLFTHWETVWYAGCSVLGVLSLVAAVMATLYTSAATALVQPQLKFNKWGPQALQNPILTGFGNAVHVASQCRTPQLNDLGDPSNPADNNTYSNSTGLKQAHLSCLQIEYAAQSYQNYIQYFGLWTAPDLNATQDMKTRPRGIALWENQTEVTGSWIDVKTVEESSKEFNLDRVIHQVHLAMPHVGVMSAAVNASNGILQPSDLDGQGVYSLRASVVSPVVHVTCVNLYREDLEPIIYESWETGDPEQQSLIIDNWNAGSFETISGGLQAPSNETMMDDLFGWSGNGLVSYDNATASFPDTVHSRPIFPRFPVEYNTILNHSGLHGREQIYMLGRPPRVLFDRETYLFCSIKTSLTAKCATRYVADGVNRGSLRASCEEEDQEMQFDKKHPEDAAIQGGTNASKDWIWMGSEWGNGVNLNDGLHAGNGSNMRVLTHLALKDFQLNTSMPSPSEALAVMASSTLLMGVRDSPFDLASYNPENFKNGTYKPFDTLIQSQLYTSGVHSENAKAFYVVLLTVFTMNLLVCLYFILERGFITDYTEPPNMFAIAMNSPPSAELNGACGRGPIRKQYNSNWFVEMDAQSDQVGHLYMVSGVVPIGRSRGLVKRNLKIPSSYYQTPEPHVTPGRHPKSPMLDLYDKFSNKRRSML